MRVDLDDRRVIVSWKHREVETTIGQGKKMKKVKRKITTCMIKPASATQHFEEIEPLSTGEAKCHSKDVWNKNEGRILSLTHALREIYPHSTAVIHAPENREIRKRFWEAYRLMRHGVVAGKAWLPLEDVLH